MSRRILLIIVLLILLLLFLAVPSVSWAQELQGNPFAKSADELGARIAAVVGKKNVKFTMRFDAQMSDDTRRRAQAAIVDALSARGMERVTENGVEMTISLRASAQGLMWVAQVELRGEEKVFIVFAGPLNESPGQRLPVATLHSELIWEQRETMLDIRVQAGDAGKSELIVLEPESAVFYSRETGEWRRTEWWPLFPSGSMRRDPWGRILKRGNEVYVFMAGYPRDMLLLNVRGKSAENFSSSSGAEFPIRNVVSWRQGERMLEAQALGDGKVTISEGPRNINSIRSDWGDEFAAVESGCGKGTQLLVTGTGDWTEMDAIRIFEFEGTEAVSIGAPLAMPGPVLALRADEDKRRALAIVRNISTGKHEAYSISISCSR